MGGTFPFVEVRNVSKSYTNCRALDGVTFSMERGEVLGVVGPNGAGKTTLLKLIAGLIRPSQGSISISGHDTVKDSLKVKELVGFLPEEDALYDDMTVREYLLYFADLFSLDRHEAEERIGRELSRFSLSGKQRVGGLSKGTKRRVSIIRALLHDPAVLIFDEPTAGLDVFLRREIESALLTLRETGKSILVSSHDLSQVEEVCTRVIVLSEGRVLLDSDIGELLAHQPHGGYIIHFLSPEGSSPGLQEMKVVKSKGRLCAVLAMSEEETTSLVKRIREIGGRVLGVTWNRRNLEEILRQRVEGDGRRD